MFKGLRTAIYQVPDIDQAKAWYSKALGVAPYFDQPFYVGFNVGGFELGLQPDNPTTEKVDNVVAYWGVDDARAALDHLITVGAKAHGQLQDVGDGIKAGSVSDPFGNVFGVIENPHFKIA